MAKKKNQEKPRLARGHPESQRKAEKEPSGLPRNLRGTPCRQDPRCEDPSRTKQNIVFHPRLHVFSTAPSRA